MWCFFITFVLMLELKLKECKSCNSGSISIYENAGFYSSTNTGGWNSPNISRNFTGTATLKIETPNGDILEYDVKQTIEDAIFPEYLVYEYVPEKLNDGIYYFTLTLVDTNTNITYKATSMKTSVCEVECCVAKLAATVASDLCNTCNSEATEKFILAEKILEALKEDINCLGEKEFNKLLSQLQKICNSTGCGC